MNNFRKLWCKFNPTIQYLAILASWSYQQNYRKSINHLKFLCQYLNTNKIHPFHHPKEDSFRDIGWYERMTFLMFKYWQKINKNYIYFFWDFADMTRIPELPSISTLNICISISQKVAICRLWTFCPSFLLKRFITCIIGQINLTLVLMGC